MKNDKHLLLKSLVPPLLFLILIWLVKLGEIVTHADLTFLGIYPRKASGLVGIVTGPVIHGDLEHLMANSIPLFVLGSSLFYFYREIALKIFVLILFLTGLSVWVGGRPAYHIGASGIVYGLAAFLFISGIVRKEPRLLAITLLVAFLYGSLVWGVFPDFFPGENISFEGHFWGLVSGTLLAFYARKEGPQRKIYEWEREEMESLEAMNGEDPEPGTGQKDH